jgi:hypothetical protein
MTIEKTKRDAKANPNEHTKRDAKADPIVGKSKTEEIAGKLTGTDGRGNHDERRPGAGKSKYVGADAVGGVREGTGKMKGGKRDDAGNGDDDDAITLDGQDDQGSEKAPKGRDA